MGFRLLARFRTVVANLEEQHVNTAVEHTLSGLKSSGGSSVGLKGQATPNKGWMVGGVAKEHVHSGGPDRVHHTDVKNFVHENAHHLADPSHFLGSWHDNKSDNVHLDVSKHFPNKEEAHSYARLHNEKAVYNLHEGKEEPTNWEETTTHR